MKMCFVGREKEVRKLTKALEGGRHVIVTGPYGIGRTRMIRQIAETGRRERRFVFVDFSKTPGEVCEKLWPPSGRKRLPAVRYDPPATGLDATCWPG